MRDSGSAHPNAPAWDRWDQGKPLAVTKELFVWTEKSEAEKFGASGQIHAPSTVGLLRGDVPPGDRNVLIKQLAAIHSAVALCDRADYRGRLQSCSLLGPRPVTNRPVKVSKPQVGRAGLEPATGRL